MRRSACKVLLQHSSIRYCPRKSSLITASAFPTRHFLPHRRPQHRRLATNRHIVEPPTIYRTLRASHTSYLVVLVALAGSAFLINFFTQLDISPPAPSQTRDTASHAPTTSSDLFFTNMPIPPGSRGNLTADQEHKLRELWALSLKTFGVVDPSHPNGVAHHDDDTPTASEAETNKSDKKKRRSLFGRKHGDSSSPSKAVDDADDKYGQVKEYQQIVSTQSPESLRSAFWSMVKADHPDALLLRFLRARKWDVDKALVMMISTMSWRGQEMHVDDDVVLNGEIGAVRDSRAGDANAKKEGIDFLQQMKLGKSFLHGTDKEGRPLCIVRARLHRGGDQSEKSMERYTVFVIETARLVLRPPVETATIVFDMTHFTMANMDYTPVKFMIKIFEANYPESLGAVLVHKSPWLFQGIWKIIKGWLDPVVAAKVHFTSSVEDLEAFVPRKQIIKELGGDEDWEYKFIEPTDNEDDLMKDHETKQKIVDERNEDVQEYQRKTFDWINAGSGETSTIKTQRDEVARKLNENYWRLDPYVRARTLYDRVGMIEKGGKINFYPSHEKATATTTAAAGQTVNAQTNADDVD